MEKERQLLKDTDPSVVSNTALKVFRRITEEWGLSEQEKFQLLGVSSSSDIVISKKTLERISYVLGIYKNLRILFPTQQQANSWIKKPNAGFDGESALSVMMRDPSIVRRYLDGQLI
ncbi:DUF2384 domain-containing protein [Marinobacter vulgaris]|uniref:DUF2384 domain-containing protein n=1 Tax=Marinobacter vulgaris TaxID=1928331 RepID=A0A2V3ZN63_9GAMM|nr:MbcA/ParS/Xre antitoxin family protein [Marinobacter vulgaris]PXX93231.1 DUF2384 domain-containing protein [Marinobacter vulgaris]TSJ72757.1 DUF2384 domain-containing protein [Marinobacter vulgaris]